MRKGKFENCIVCKKDFYLRPYLCSGNRFCSRKCYGINKQKREGVKCLNCKKLKIIKISDIKRGRKFCSHLCSEIFSKGKPKNVSEEFKKKRILNLGARMLGKKHSIKTKEKMSLAQIGKPKLYMRGEKNKWWKGGRSSLTKQIRESLQYKIWRRNIFIRDDYSCVMGGREHGNNLVADHLNSFASILIKNKITSLDQAFECFELWDITNGRTLCYNCHKETENYGWKEFHRLYRLKV